MTSRDRDVERTALWSKLVHTVFAFNHTRMQGTQVHTCTYTHTLLLHTANGLSAALHRRRRLSDDSARRGDDACGCHGRSLLTTLDHH